MSVLLRSCFYLIWECLSPWNFWEKRIICFFLDKILENLYRIDILYVVTLILLARKILVHFNFLPNIPLNWIWGIHREYLSFFILRHIISMHVSRIHACCCEQDGMCEKKAGRRDIISVFRCLLFDYNFVRNLVRGYIRLAPVEKFIFAERCPLLPI